MYKYYYFFMNLIYNNKFRKFLFKNFNNVMWFDSIY